MAQFNSVTGIIQNISRQEDGCTLAYTVACEGQGQITVLLPSDAYVLNGRPFTIGDRVTFFYDSNAPMVLIFPPQYRAVAAALTPHGVTAALDIFTRQAGFGFGNALISSTGNLALIPSASTRLRLPNGQSFLGNISGKLLLVTYSASTRSIPAQTTPEEIIVFCSWNPWQL